LKDESLACWVTSRLRLNGGQCGDGASISGRPCVIVSSEFDDAGSQEVVQFLRMSKRYHQLKSKEEIVPTQVPSQKRKKNPQKESFCLESMILEERVAIDEIRLEKLIDQQLSFYRKDCYCELSIPDDVVGIIEGYLEKRNQQSESHSNCLDVNNHHCVMGTIWSPI
jgi:hypothetical protein